jgi:hypothetical protein
MGRFWSPFDRLMISDLRASLKRLDAEGMEEQRRKDKFSLPGEDMIWWIDSTVWKVGGSPAKVLRVGEHQRCC